jgi:hypothetical protein
VRSRILLPSDPALLSRFDPHAAPPARADRMEGDKAAQQAERDLARACAVFVLLGVAAWVHIGVRLYSLAVGG